MRSLLVARRDLAAYVSSLSAYVIFAALLMLEGGFFQAFALGRDEASYSHEVLENFLYLNWGFVVTSAVLLTMRSFADEATLGTEALLRTSVLSDAQVVIGKWLAAMGMVTTFATLTLYMPALIFVNGSVSLAHVAVGYGGVLLGGAVTAALGVLCSAIFRHQLASGFIAGVLTVYMAVLAWMFAEIAAPPFDEVLAYTALFNQHFVPFMEGRLSISSVVYHLTLTAGLLFAATHVLHSRRWE